MKVFGVISITALFLLVGATIPAFAQDNRQQQEEKPTKQEQQAKPQKQQQDQKQQEQAKSSRQQQQQQAKGQQQQAKSENQQQNRQVTQDERGNSQGHQHAQRTAVEVQRQRSEPALRLSERGEGRIPDDRYRAHFGREHEFRIGSPRMVDGYSRFQYGGYWFGFVQPWPAGWYYTDDVYIEYINGQYFLLNPDYPGAEIFITVVM